MKTTQFVRKEDIKPVWYVLDAADQPLGRVASMAAFMLRGKHRPDFTPNIDMGDHIIVLNIDQIRLTGRKLENKMYYRHSGYPGGMKSENAERVMSRYPDRVFLSAVKGMLPKNRLGRKLIKKLRIYTGVEHNHEAQKPTKISLSGQKTVQVAK
jgi:large subunit ribosomal protein L13